MTLWAGAHHSSLGNYFWISLIVLRPPVWLTENRQGQGPSSPVNQGALHRRFFLAASALVSGRGRVCLRPTKLLVIREKKPLVPRGKGLSTPCLNSWVFSIGSQKNRALYWNNTAKFLRLAMFYDSRIIKTTGFDLPQEDQVLFR